MFASRPIPDVVQTALSEPAGNEVYKQAKEEALERSKKGKQLYVDWWYVVMIMLMVMVMVVMIVVVVVMMVIEVMTMMIIVFLVAVRVVIILIQI